MTNLHEDPIPAPTLEQIQAATDAHYRRRADAAAETVTLALQALVRSGGAEPHDRQLLAAIESWRAGDVG